MLNYGFIGCGWMGQEHIENINQLGAAKVAAVYEPDEDMAAAALNLAPGAQREPSIDSLIQRGDLHALVITSPNYVHGDQLRQIASQVTLPILVEKPVVTREADLSLIRQLQAGYKAPIWVAMEYRYMPAVARFLEQADEITGGITMLSIREHRFPFLPKVGNWNRFNAFSGGTFVEKCCHFFDLMRLTLGKEPTRIMASAAQSHNHKFEMYEQGQADIWDNGFVIVDFQDDTRALLDLCMFAEGSTYQEELTAVGPNGKIEAQVPGPYRMWPKAAGPAPTARLITSPRAPKGPETTYIPVDQALLEIGDHNGATFYQHRKFAQMVRDGGTPEVSLEDGWQAVRLGLAAQAAASDGMALSLSGPNAFLPG